MSGAEPSPVELVDVELVDVELVDVDERVLTRLVAAAATGAEPDEVTPVVGDAVGWSAERVAWLVQYHRSRRAGVAGPLHEATWAVVLDGAVVGSVRLARTGSPGRLETGVWLVREVRGRGAGRAALSAVLDRAAALGAQEVLAVTTAGNTASRALLSALGFNLTRPGGRDQQDRVHGTVSMASRIAAAKLAGRGTTAPRPPRPPVPRR